MTTEEDTQSNNQNLNTDAEISLRAIVTTKEAGVTIGKQGKSVSVVREVTGVKVGISKVLPGIHERILSVSGPLPNVSKVILLHLLISSQKKAFALISENLIDSINSTQLNTNNVDSIY